MINVRLTFSLTLLPLAMLACEGGLSPGPDRQPPIQMQTPDGGAPTIVPPKAPEDAGLVPPMHDAGAGPGCEGLDYRGRCDGDVVHWCGTSNTIESRDCAEHGLTCGWLDDETGNWCLSSVPPGGVDAGTARTDAGTAGTDAGTSPPPSIGPPTCFDWPEQQTLSDATWGSTLTDIVRHLPPSYGSTYYDSDHVTYGHETSHGIHAHIRIYLDDTGTGANGFYVPGNRACLVREPMMRKSDVASYVPTNLRWSRYELYVTGSTAWDDTPLYLWDEWNGYVNGAEVGVERALTGLWTSGWRGTVDGVIEFVVYGVAVGMAAEAREPGYFAREPNFLRFMAFELERSMQVFRQGQVIELMRYDGQDEHYEKLRTSTEAGPMRDWIRSHFGASWTMRVMGF